MDILVHSEAPVQEASKNEKQGLAPYLTMHMRFIRHIRLDWICATMKSKVRSVKK